MPMCPIQTCPYEHMIIVGHGSNRFKTWAGCLLYLLYYTYYVAHMPMCPIPKCPSKSRFKAFMPYQKLLICPYGLDRMIVYLYSSGCSYAHMPYAHTPYGMYGMVWYGMGWYGIMTIMTIWFRPNDYIGALVASDAHMTLWSYAHMSI